MGGIREQQEHCVFEQLLDSYPSLLEHLKGGSEEQILHIGELVHFFQCSERESSYNLQVGKGAAGAIGDDTKTLKSVILDWISLKGEAIQPPLHRNSKIDHGFNHELTGSPLCPAGLDCNDPQYVALFQHLCSPEILFVLLYIKKDQRQPLKWQDTCLWGSVAHLFVCPPCL